MAHMLSFWREIFFPSLIYSSVFTCFCTVWKDRRAHLSCNMLEDTVKQSHSAQSASVSCLFSLHAPAVHNKIERNSIIVAAFPQTNDNKVASMALVAISTQKAFSHINTRLMVTTHSKCNHPPLLCRWFSVILSVTGRDARHWVGLMTPEPKLVKWESNTRTLL